MRYFSIIFFRICFIVFSLMISTLASAQLSSQIVDLEPVQIPHNSNYELKSGLTLEQIRSWNSEYLSLSSGSSQNVECRPLYNLSNTLICLYPNFSMANDDLLRASFFVEANRNTISGSVTSQEDAELIRRDFEPHGHNRNTVDLLNFYDQAVELCTLGNSGSNFCLSQSEANFFEQLVIPYKNYVEKDFYLITYVIDEPGQSWPVIVSHEVWHAYFYEDRIYKELVTNFWNNEQGDRVRNLSDSFAPGLSESERVKIKRILKFGDTYGEVENVLIDEFQAYCNMLDSEIYQRNFREQCDKFDFYLQKKGFIKPDFQNPLTREPLPLPIPLIKPVDPSEREQVLDNRAGVIKKVLPRGYDKNQRNTRPVFI